ncbi:MAG: flagellar export chaperone FliS [Oscillospiraceae bacterium]|nr:flagellar export chaperone FliS [Oscillospiraceae bacterium]
MNPYSAYKRQSVSTMTNIEIVVKGYDECERQLNRAVSFIKSKEYVEAHNSLDKAAELITAFQTCLDMSVGEVSENLNSLYSYFFKQIIKADMKKDVAIIEELLPLISDLKDAFVQISLLPKGQHYVS